MTRLFLISNSTQPGGRYLEHCATELRAFLGSTRTLLFVPYALRDHDAYVRTVRTALAPWQIEVRSAHEPVPAGGLLAGIGAVFVGGGNTFRLLKTLYELELLPRLRQAVAQGISYIGSSAGSNVACPSIRTTNDMPIVFPPSLDALGLVPFQINPHYLDADPTSKHMGETRETRLREFHEENDVAVVGLREGTWLQREGSHLRLGGIAPARLFNRGQAAVELAPQSDLSFLLA